MKRHVFDPLSFIFGLAFVALAGAFSLPGINLETGLLRWIAAGVLLIIGTVMLITSKSATRFDEPSDPVNDSAAHRR